MSIINILDKEVYNKIAAGEVVEKPASVVKELVENCIDAKATNITIEILDGGIQQIKVSDNGCGIAYDDFEKVFIAHATSKIKTIDDLSKIGTLGFRGEALSSIASVSKITLASKVENDICGYQVKVTGGEMGEITPIGATTGTFIIVEDLFFNIPARKKFLRKPKLEENDITNYIARLILANPNISIKYIADNKIIYQSFGTGLYDAIYSIYGKSIVDNIFEFEFKKSDFSFNGYLGKPTFSKPNRTYQTLIINGRYVINQTISTAIYKAFENFIMKGTFPFFVINLNIPLDKVDVNVHPNKLDVKFEDSNSVFGIVYTEITDILYNVSNTKRITVEAEIKEENTVNKTLLKDLSNIGSQFESNNDNKTRIQDNTNFIQNNSDEIKEVSLSDEMEYESNKTEKEKKEFEERVNGSIQEEKIVPMFIKSFFDFKVSSPDYDSSKINRNNLEQNEIINNKEKELIVDKQSLLTDSNNFKIIGTLFNTYIIIEQSDDLILIDQHAGHERLLYDKYSMEQENKQVAIQPLLVPYILETNYVEASYINDNIDTLKKLGFEIDEFGDNSFKVSTVPVLFDNINLREFFDNILSDIDNKLILSKNNTLKEYLAKTACKTAVKGKDKLNDNEIEILINNINQPDQVLLCPHGRPISTTISKKEIEKWFKRIV